MQGKTYLLVSETVIELEMFEANLLTNIYSNRENFADEFCLETKFFNYGICWNKYFQQSIHSDYTIFIKIEKKWSWSFRKAKATNS